MSHTLSKVQHSQLIYTLKHQVINERSPEQELIRNDLLGF